MASSITNLLLISSLLVASHLCVFADIQGAAEKTVPLAKGLSWEFYAKSCPDAQSIIRKELKNIFKQDIAQAAGLLRLHFHDCFVQVNQRYTCIHVCTYIYLSIKFLLVNFCLYGGRWGHWSCLGSLKIVIYE